MSRVARKPNGGREEGTWPTKTKKPETSAVNIRHAAAGSSPRGASHVARKTRDRASAREQLRDVALRVDIGLEASGDDPTRA